MPRIDQRIGSLLSRGRNGWPGAVRGYHSMRGFTIGPYIHEGVTAEGAVALLQRDIEGIVTRTGAFRTRDSNRLNIIMTPENAFCGESVPPSSDQEGGATWEYPAKNTLPIEARPFLARAMAKLAQSLAERLREGFVIVTTTTYDTGLKTPEGLPIAINSAIVTQDPTNTLYVEKTSATIADGLGNYVLLAQDGQLQAFRAKDFFGDGRDVTLQVRICSDLTRNLPSVIDSSRKIDLAVVPAYGLARETHWQNAPRTVFIADGIELDQGNLLDTGAWVRDVKDVIRGTEKYLRVNGSNFSGRVLEVLGKFFAPSPQREAQSRHFKVPGNKIYRDESSIFAVESPEVRIPNDVTEDQLDDAISGRITGSDFGGASFQETPDEPGQIETGPEPRRPEERVERK
jgi:hypothetical protein